MTYSDAMQSGSSSAGVRSMLVDVGAEVGKNAAMKVPALRERRLRRPRTSDRVATQGEKLERYAFQSLRTLTRVAGGVTDRRIAEIGPGDYLTSGLALLAAGARSYTAIDRFPGDYAGSDAKDWYRSIRSAWSDHMPQRVWPEDLDVERFPEGYPGRVTTVAASIEAAALDQQFDIVCSFQVGEHVSDLRSFAVKSQQLLRPEGVAVHRVDFGPHGPWRRYADPLTFLRPPDRLWGWMGSNRGTPNRHRAHEFEAAFEAAGLDVESIEVELFAGGRVDAVRHRLAKRFRDMPTGSLATRAVTYVCRAHSAA